MNIRIKSLIGLCALMLCGAGTLGLSSCKSNKQKEEHSDEEHSENAGIAVLTQENLDAAGIRIGKLEYKELSVMIRVSLAVFMGEWCSAFSFMREQEWLRGKR